MEPKQQLDGAMGKRIRETAAAAATATAAEATVAATVTVCKRLIIQQTRERHLDRHKGIRIII